MGGSQGGSQGAAGKVIFGHTESFLLLPADLLDREHMAKTPSDPSPLSKSSTHNNHIQTQSSRSMMWKSHKYVL